MALFSSYPYDPPEKASILYAVVALKVNSVIKEGNKNVLEKFYGNVPYFPLKNVEHTHVS